jgi:hypothetical protein
MNNLRTTLFISALFLCVSLTPANAHPGVGIVMDSHGNIFYTDLKQVWKIDTHGKQTVVVPRVQGALCLETHAVR